MADQVLANGPRELRAAVDRLPETVTAALKQTAKGSADRIARRAADILRSKTHGTGKTADSIRVLDESERQQFVVNCPGDPSSPANLPLWLERGTRYMTAKAFMRPAADEETDRYIRNMTAAAEDAVTKALG